MNALAVLALALVVFISAITTGWSLLFHLAWLLVAVTLFGFLWTRLAFRGLSVLRDSAQTRVQVGDVLRERLGLRNASVWPKLWLEVHDSGNLPGRSSGNVVSVGSTSEKRWRRRTVCTQRGQYRLGPLMISSADPFGLFSRSIMVGVARELLVYPQVVPLPDFTPPALELPGGNIAQRRAFHSTPTVTTVREYEPGDSLSRVSWKATARQQKLMVKEFELDPVADVWVVVDLDRRLHVESATRDRAVREDGERHYLNSTVEYSVAAAASVLSAMLERGRSVGLITWSGSRQIVLPDRGARQLWKTLEILSVLQASETPPLREVLLSHQSFFAGNHSLLVITPDTSGGWRTGVDLAVGRRVPVTAIYVDALSFDPRMPRLLPMQDQRAGRFYSYTLRNGDDIRHKLGNRVGLDLPLDIPRLEAV